MKFLIPLLIMIISLFAQAQSPDDARRLLILEAFNQRKEFLVEPLTLEDIQIKNGVGRVDVNKKAKFSYYIQTEEPSNPQSKITLIPMATSRFTPTYYQTDAWWDAHKDMKPMPRQPMEEVAAWLKEMKLSTNPDVLILNPGSAVKVQRQPLQDFLLQHYLRHYAKDGKIVIYRGAERANESQEWQAGRKPKGVRYWTPSALYAWRYARKNKNFIQDLLAGNSPLLKFEIPVADFIAMTKGRWPKLTLGTELPKSTHVGFASSGEMRDHLAGHSPFLGEGRMGVDFEIRSNSAGASAMTKYFAGPASIEDIASDRIRIIETATARLIKQTPEKTEQLNKSAEERIRTIEIEKNILLLLQSAPRSEEIPKLASQISRPEITNIDYFNLNSFIVEAKAKAPASVSCKAAHL